jgi:hypothetical protein
MNKMHLLLNAYTTYIVLFLNFEKCFIIFSLKLLNIGIERNEPNK